MSSEGAEHGSARWWESSPAEERESPWFPILMGNEIRENNVNQKSSWKTKVEEIRKEVQC